MLSLVIASGLERQQGEYKSLREGRGQTMIFCAVLTALWSRSLSSTVGEPHNDAVGQDALDGRAVEGH